MQPLVPSEIQARVEEYTRGVPLNDEAQAGRALTEIMAAQASIKEWEPKLMDARERLREAVVLAHQAGVPASRLAWLLGVSLTRIYQVIEAGKVQIEEKRSEQP